MSPSDRIAAYLRAAGWEKGELARRAGISPSTVTRLLHGRKTSGGAEPYDIGELVALKLERATVQAWTLGQTTVPPLRAIDLVPGRAA